MERKPRKGYGQIAGYMTAECGRESVRGGGGGGKARKETSRNKFLVPLPCTKDDILMQTEMTSQNFRPKF